MENFKGSIIDALDHLEKLEQKYLHYQRLDQKYNGDLISIKIEKWRAEDKLKAFKEKLKNVNVNF